MRRIIVLLFGFLPLIASAVGLGQLSLNSALNQPFAAKIKLLSLRGVDVDEVLVRLASPREFSKLGLKRPYYLTKLRFRAVMDDAGEPVIQVSSRAPISEPVVQFLLHATWPGGEAIRKYTLLLDPPLTVKKATVRKADLVIPEKPVAAVAVNPKFISGAMPVNRKPVTPKAKPLEKMNVTSIVASSTRLAPALPVPLQSVAAVKTPAPRLKPKHAPVTAMKPKPRPKAKPKMMLPVALPGHHVSLTYGPTDRYDNLWEIALGEIESSPVNVYKMMYALLLANPNAFLGGNNNRLQTGVILKIPSAELVNSLKLADAQKVLGRQNLDWQAGRRQVNYHRIFKQLDKGLLAAQPADVKAKLLAEHQAAKLKQKNSLNKIAHAPINKPVPVMPALKVAPVKPSKLHPVPRAVVPAPISGKPKILTFASLVDAAKRLSLGESKQTQIIRKPKAAVAPEVKKPIKLTGTEQSISKSLTATKVVAPKSQESHTIIASLTEQVESLVAAVRTNHHNTKQLHARLDSLVSSNQELRTALQKKHQELAKLKGVPPEGPAGKLLKPAAPGMHKRPVKPPVPQSPPPGALNQPAKSLAPLAGMPNPVSTAPATSTMKKIPAPFARANKTAASDFKSVGLNPDTGKPFSQTDVMQTFDIKHFEESKWYRNQYLQFGLGAGILLLLIALLARKRVRDSMAMQQHESHSEDDDENETAKRAAPSFDSRMSSVPVSDPLSEAEIYISHSRFDEARALLADAISQNPNRISLRLKLLEALAAMDDHEDFEEQVSELTSGRFSLEPNQLQLIEELRTISWPGGSEGQKIIAPSETDAEETSNLDDAVAELTEEIADEEKTAEDEPVASDHRFDSGLNSLGEEEAEADSPVGSVADLADDSESNVIEFEHGLTDKPFEVNDDFSPESDPFQAKLDMAVALADMDDRSGAKDLLVEVSQSGNDEQRMQAKTLLARLGYDNDVVG